MYKIKRGVKIMEIKKFLRILNNQYFKSLKRFKKTCSNMEGFKQKVRDFNNRFLNLLSAVLKGDVSQIHINLYRSLVYIWATSNEKKKIDLELNENIFGLKRTK